MGTGRFYETAKRSIDVAVSGLGLLVLSPVIVVVALAVRRDLGSPVLFRQRRPGRHDELFTLVKFRSMRDGEADDAARLTPFGARLRSTSLDELPTLWNVFRGDMSLVGPRPLLVDYLDRYSPQQRRRNEVRPGVTGLAQVAGRNTVGWADRFALDVEYVETRSLGVDLKILRQTIGLVVRREGISAEGSSTMQAFLGDEETPETLT